MQLKIKIRVEDDKYFNLHKLIKTTKYKQDANCKERT